MPALVSSTGLPRIAVLGAGHSGPVIARVAIDAGYRVSIAASGDPEQIELIAQVLVPGAEPLWAADAAAVADIVVLAVPLHKFATLDPSLLSGKLVVDVMNYWPAVDGVVPMFDDRQRGSSEIVQLSRIWSSASATTPSGWTAWAPAASSNPAARSSACRCAGWSSSAPYAQKPPSARDPVPYPQQKEDRT